MFLVAVWRIILVALRDTVVVSKYIPTPTNITRDETRATVLVSTKGLRTAHHSKSSYV